MSSIVEKVKDKLNLGKSSDTASSQTHGTGTQHSNVTQAPGGPGTDQTGTGTKLASGTTHHSSHHQGHGKPTQCTQDHEHTAACGMPVHDHGKQDAWQHAHAKTHEASKHANASELAACKAQEKYSTMTEAQKNADNARRRQKELEAELEKLRGQGVDISGHQKRLEEHKRHLADLENQHAQATRAAQEAQREAALHEREAGKLHDMHARKQEGLTPLEAELDNLRRERESAHANHQSLLGEHNDRQKKHQARAAEIERHHKELPTHANKIKELEAELAAAKERYNHHHHHLTGLQNEHEAYERDLPNHQKRLDHAHSRIGLLKEKEAEMMRQHQARQADLEKHRGVMSDAEKQAEAHRAKAEDARRQAEGLPGQIEEHKEGMAPLQQEHAEAMRRQKELDMKSHKLGDHLDKARAHADKWDTTTAQASDNLEQARREAEMHAERKERAWNEAQQAGKGGASLEGSHLTHLKEKIKEMGPGHKSHSSTTTSHHSATSAEP